MTMLQIVDVEVPIALPPMIYPHTRPFWEALASGRFLAQRCENCAQRWFPPRQACSCRRSNLHWIEISGAGRLYSRTRVHSGPPSLLRDGSYALAIVDTEEGLRLACAWMGGPEAPLDCVVELIVTRYINGCLFAARDTAV